jgi:hypothetical protein
MWVIHPPVPRNAGKRLKAHFWKRVRNLFSSDSVRFVVVSDLQDAGAERVAPNRCEIHGRAETKVAVATLVRSADLPPHEDEIRSVEGPDASKGGPEGTAPRTAPLNGQVKPERC